VVQRKSAFTVAAVCTLSAPMLSNLMVCTFQGKGTSRDEVRSAEQKEPSVIGKALTRNVVEIGSVF